MTKSFSILLASLVALASASPSVFAKDHSTGEGALIGGAAGAAAGHPVAGAAVGAGIGHHEKKKHQKQQQKTESQQNTAPSQ